jgi:hypothetical protein
MIYAFDQWCQVAVSKIRYKPDRVAIYNELYTHLEDLYYAATDRGFTAKDAEAEALKAMGSPTELAPQFGAIHSPWLGYLLNLTRWLLYALCAAVLLQTIAFFRNDTPSPLQTPWYFENPGGEIENSWSGYPIVERRVLYMEPEVSAHSDGFTFKTTRAALVLTDSQTDLYTDYYTLYIQIEVSSLLQWAQLDDIPADYFWAVDSLGNTYLSLNHVPDLSQPYVSGDLIRTDFFTQTMEMELNSFCSADAEWLELRYDRNGRDIRLRIDLTGGDSQ